MTCLSSTLALHYLKKNTVVFKNNNESNNRQILNIEVR